MYRLAGPSFNAWRELEHLPDSLPRWLDDPVGRAATVERR
jgi:hypothetical protein